MRKRTMKKIAILVVASMIFSSVGEYGYAYGKNSDSVEYNEKNELLRIIDSEDISEPFSYGIKRSEIRKSGKIRLSDGWAWETDTGMDVSWHHTDIDSVNSWIMEESSGHAPGEGVVVAVIDTGADISHPDLSANLWVNEAEYNGQSGVDDDSNGYVDDIYGGNTVAPGTQMTDVQGHGTQMSGIIAMVAGNGGGVGVSYGARVMPVRVAVGEEFTVDDAAKGIQYALDNGADIISMSFSTTSKSSKLESVMREASEKCILVAASGNENITTNTPSYPAAYDFVTGIMAYNNTDQISNFSNWDINPGSGAEYELASPGSEILAPTLNHKFVLGSGTSQATAVTAGAMAVALSKLRRQGIYPDPASFKSWFLSTQTHVTSADAAHSYLTYKRLNLLDAMTASYVVPATPTPTTAVIPAATKIPVPTVPSQSQMPAATQTPVVSTPVTTAAPSVSAAPATPTPSASAQTVINYKKGQIVSAGKGKTRAYYKIKNAKKRTVIYYRCNVKNSIKKAKIPEYIKLSDGKRYEVVSVKKRAFTKKKKVKKLVIFSPYITIKMIINAIRGSKIKIKNVRLK